LQQEVTLLLPVLRLLLLASLLMVLQAIAQQLRELQPVPVKELLARRPQKQGLQRQQLLLQQVALKASPRWLPASLLARHQSQRDMTLLLLVLRLLQLAPLLAVLQAIAQLLLDLLLVILRERLARLLQKWVLQQRTLQRMQVAL
jgi:uncharacterized metal-binding protein